MRREAQTFLDTFVEEMFDRFTKLSGWNLDAQTPQPGGGNQQKERRFAQPIVREILQTLFD
jgi:hypothetical protein